MIDEVIEGEVTPVLPTDADEQVQPDIQQETPQDDKPEEKIDIRELMFNKLNEIHANRASAISEEDRVKGMRLLRSPYDDLYFEDVESFINELERINKKTSNLSASKRAAMIQLQSYVIAELTQAKVDSANEEAQDDASTAEEVPADITE